MQFIIEGPGDTTEWVEDTIGFFWNGFCLLGLHAWIDDDFDIVGFRVGVIGLNIFFGVLFSVERKQE